MIHPELQPSSFGVSDVTDSAPIWHKPMDKNRLGCIVVGLINGLGRLLETPVSIIQKESWVDHDVFTVEWENR